MGLVPNSRGIRAGVVGFAAAGLATSGIATTVAASSSPFDDPQTPTAVVRQALTEAQPSAPVPATELEARDCLTTITGLGPANSARIRPRMRQVVVTVGKGRKSSYSTVQGWRKDAAGCWNLEWSRAGRNGYTGWHPRPWDGSGYSPIGVYRLSDAGGRLPNPGTRLPYHHQPEYWSRGGFKMNDDAVQVFNYVVAINFNRYPGRSPRDLSRPNPNIPDGGIWFHVGGGGATRGCISLPESDMIMAMEWLDPGQRPVMVMGPKKALRR